VNHSLKIDLSAHSFSEHFTENRILLLHFQWIHSLKIDSSAQSYSEPFTENSFYVPMLSRRCSFRCQHDMTDDGTPVRRPMPDGCAHVVPSFVPLSSLF